MTPAQLAAPLSCPYFSIMESIQASTSLRLETSTFVIINWADRDLKYSSAVKRPFGSMSATQTIAPREDMILAVARPMPEAPPVMAMTWSFIDMANSENLDRN